MWHKKQGNMCQGSCAMHIIKWILKHLLLSFCCHITHYAAIDAYKYVGKPFPFQYTILPN